MSDLRKMHEHIANCEALIGKQAAEIVKLRAEPAEAEAIIKPFAAIDCAINKPDEPVKHAFDAWHPSRTVFSIGSERQISVGDLRKAAAWLKGRKG